MSCCLFNTMNHSVRTKLATICGSRHFAPKQMPTQRFDSVMSTQLHVACTREFQLIFETADQSGFGSHFGSCSALPFQFFAVFLCLFCKIKTEEHSKLHNATLLRSFRFYVGENSRTFQDRIVEFKDFSRIFGNPGLFKDLL